MYYPEASKAFIECVTPLKGKAVAVLGHARPDGDCIGSQVGLCRILTAMGVDAVAVNLDPVPRVLQPFAEGTRVYMPSEVNLAERLLIYVDCADIARVGEGVADKKPYLNIDHHVTNTEYAEHNIVIREAAATAQMLAGFALDNGLPIDAETAQALYLGVASDTGNFLYPSVAEDAFRICADLVHRGAKPGDVGIFLYQSEKFETLKLLQKFLSTFKLEEGGRICIGFLTTDDYTSLGATQDMSEGFVDFTRSIDGVDLGVFLTVNPDGSIKGSLRGKDPRFRMDQLAKQFGGGGHTAAAGFTVKNTTLQSFYPTFLDQAKTFLKVSDES